MSFLSIPDLPDVPSLTPGRHPAVYTQLPKVQSALQRKYSDPGLTSALGRLPPHIRTSFVNYDLARAGKGQMPLTGAQTLGALQTVAQQQAATPRPKEGLFGRALADVRSLVDIPHVVTGLVGEAKALPEAPAKLGEVLGRGSPRDVVAGLQEVPGLRLVPGVYTASTVAQGGPQALLEHPVYAGLDVLPYAKAPISKLANAAVVSERFPATAARVAGEAKRLADVIGPTNELRDIVGGFPNLEMPSNVRLAARTSPNLTRFRQMRFMQHVAGRFGTYARDAAQLVGVSNSRLQNWAHPDTALTHPAVAGAPEIAPLRAAVSDMMQYKKTIPDARRIELTDRAMLESTPDLLNSLSSDTEMGFVNKMKEHADTIADFVVPRDWGITRLDGEIFTRQDARNIQRARNVYSNRVGINGIKNQIDTAVPGTFPALDDHLALMRDENVTAGTARTMGAGIAHLIDKSGFNGRLVRDAANAKGAGKDSIIAAVEKSMAEAPEGPLMAKQEVMDLVTPHALAERRVGPTGEEGTAYAEVRRLMSIDDYQNASRVWNKTIGARKTFVHPQGAEIGDALARYRDAQKWQTRTAGYSDKAVAKAEAFRTKIERKTLPAKYIPMIEKLRYDPATKTGALYEHFSDDPAAIAELDKGYPAAIAGLRDNPQLLREINADIVERVAQMRAEGFNPIFVHRVSRGQIPQIVYPKITDFLKKPSQVKARTLDATPYVHDATVAVSHQAVEAMSRHAQEQFVDHFVKMFGKDQATAIAEVRNVADRMGGGDPLRTMEAANELIGRNYVKYDPKTYFPGSRAALTTAPRFDTYIPKAVDIALKDMFHDGFRFSAALDPVMNLFRMSVLAFSPRFHLNNIGGGAMMMGLEDPAALAYTLRNWRKVREFAKTGEMHGIEGMPPGGIGFFPGQMQDWLKQASWKDKIRALHDLAAGKTMARWMDEAAGGGEHVAGFVERAAQKSYQLNQVVDDFYRAGAYLYRHDKSLTKGLTEAESRAAGVALVRKVLPEWDRMTQFERNVVRSVFPFYSFSKFIMQYALRFPFDHPFRTSVMASLARNEMEDFGDWLPLNFSKMFFLGHPDAKGNVRAIDPGAINPFQDVSSMFTMGGIVGRMNPLISTFLETMGIDPSKGVQDLYPDISYDPATGTLKPRNPNLLSTLIENVVPQSQVITSLIDRNSNFAGMLKANPESAIAYLRSSVGLPNPFKTVNLPQVAFKAEVSRESLQDQIKNQALKSGDWSEVKKYPGLRPFFDKLGKALQQNPELFKAYQSSVAQPSVGDVLPTALLKRNLPIG